MNRDLELLKGIHPGLYLQRELKKRNIKSKELANGIHEHPQTLSAIIQGRRAMNVPLSLRIEQYWDLEEGFLMTLQLFYDIEQEKRRQNELIHPDLSKYRPVLFWDTTLDKIDWIRHKEFVINRVFERGTKEEILETIRFYGEGEIVSWLHNGGSFFSPSVKKSAKHYLNHV